MKQNLMRYLNRSDENGFVATRPRSAKKGKYKTNAKTLLPYRPVPKYVSQLNQLMQELAFVMTHEMND